MDAEVIHPLALFQVQQQGAAGVAQITSVMLAVGELPKEPRFHGAKAEVIGGGGGSCFSVVLQHPTDFAGTEIGVEQEPCASPPVLFQSLALPVCADGCGPTVLPDQRWTARNTGAASPKHGCFPLVGDPTAHHRLALIVTQLLLKVDEGLPLARPDL